MFEIKGYWWIPNKPEIRVAGNLTYVPQESTTLELIGAFDKSKSAVEAFISKRDEPVIWGISSDSKKVTIFNCHAFGKLNFSCPFPIIKYTCQYILIGSHLDDYNLRMFCRATVRFPLMSQWCPPEAISTSLIEGPDKNIEKIKMELATNRPSIDTLIIDDETTFIIEGNVVYLGDYLSPKIEQYTSLTICKHIGASFIDICSDIYMYEQFLSFATLKEIKASSIDFFVKKDSDQSTEEYNPYESVKLIYVQRDYVTPDVRQPYEFLFTYDVIKEKYHEVLDRWFRDKKEIAPIRQHLIDSIKTRPVFSSVDFLIVIQALEGFCSRFRKEASLTQMITCLIDEFSDIDKLKKDKISIKQTVDSRHYYSHFMSSGKKKNVIDGYELYELTTKLRKLLICCMLSYAGFNNTEINVILNRSNSKILCTR